MILQSVYEPKYLPHYEFKRQQVQSHLFEGIKNKALILK